MNAEQFMNKTGICLLDEELLSLCELLKTHAIVPRNQSGKLTKEQAIIVSGYTQILMCDFSDLHKDIETRLGHPVFTHQIPQLGDVIKAAYKDDFLALCTTTPGKVFL